MKGEGRCGAGGAGPLWSHLAGWDDLLVPVPSADASGLDLSEGWPDRWTVTRRIGRDEVACTVRPSPQGLGRTPGSTWHKLANPGRFVHYAELRKLLIEHGDRLAKDIDARAGAACSFPGSSAERTAE